MTSQDTAAETDADALLARLRAFEGRPSGPPTEARDEVNQAMIRHWVEAMGDENPVYADEKAARANGFPGVMAPPTMLQAWIMRGYRSQPEAPGSAQGRVGRTLRARADVRGVRRGRVHVRGGDRTASRSTSAPSSSATGSR